MRSHKVSGPRRARSAIRPLGLLAAGVVALGLLAPSLSASGETRKALVTWKVSGETFRTYLTRQADVNRVRQAIRAHGSAGIPIGRVVRGTRENTGHPWHLEGVQLAEVTIELCDGRPSDLDRDVDYWAGTVKRYCPWAARPAKLRLLG